MFALALNHFETAKYLIGMGANIHAKSVRGNGMLHISCKLGSLEMTQFFVSMGLDMHESNCENESPLQLSHKGGFDFITEWMFNFAESLSNNKF
jgi:hypothetical protein